MLRMSLVHRTAFLALSALLAVASGACGDDDALSDDGGADDDGTRADAGGGGGESDAGGGNGDAAPPLPDGGKPDGGGDTDGGTRPDGGDADGGTPDAAPGDAGTPDAGQPDAAPPDAAPPDGAPPDAAPPDAALPDPQDGEFLLSVAVELFPNNPIRFITTVEFTQVGEGGTADFTFQPIIAPNCVPETSGFPVGTPVTVTGIPIAADGTFNIDLVGATLPGPANPIPLPGIQCTELTGNVSVTGAIVNPDLSCGDAEVTAGTITIPGSFGAIRIVPGTVGDDNLPAPVSACP
jgi:hypothetical protein